MAIDTKLADKFRSVVRLDSLQVKSERAATVIDSTVTAAAAADSGSVYTMCRVPMRARIHGLSEVSSTGTPAFSIGLKPVDATIAASATALAAARTLTANTPVRVIETAERRGLRVWELLGLSGNPEGFADITFTLTAAFTAGGPITGCFVYSVD